MGARVGPHAIQAAWPGGVSARGRGPVHGEVGPAAEQVVVDARRVGNRGVDLSRLSLASGQAIALHGYPPDGDLLIISYSTDSLNVFSVP